MTITERRRWLALAALAAAPAAAMACSQGEANEAPEIQTVEVRRSDLRVTAEATGSMEPITTVEVKSKAGGEILKLYVDVGDEVEPGDLLAEIDPRDVRNNWEQTLADLEVARVRAQIAETNLSRQERLHAQGVIADQELENARVDASNARATLIRARADSTLAELQLEDVTIRARMPGTILTRLQEEGSVIQSAAGNVSGGTVLFNMANLGLMQVRTLVDETDMGSIQPGMSAQVSVEAYPDRSFVGTVEKIEPQAVVQSNVTMFPVIVTLDNRNGLLKPGMNSEVEILIDEVNDVLVIPNGAVVMPQDVVPAAMALGVDVDQVELSEMMSGGRFGGPLADVNGEGSPAPEGGASGGRTDADPDAAGGRLGGRPSGSRAEGGRQMTPEMLERLREARAQGGFGGRGGRGARQGERQTRRAAVFVVDEAGNIEPRMIEIGLSDWDNAQVVSGLEEGERLAIVGGAQLLQAQQESLDRMRNRMGGGDPFGGGGGRRR